MYLSGLLDTLLGFSMVGESSPWKIPLENNVEILILHCNTFCCRGCIVEPSELKTLFPIHENSLRYTRELLKANRASRTKCVQP
jgi:hypothetical protein